MKNFNKILLGSVVALSLVGCAHEESRGTTKEGSNYPEEQSSLGEVDLSYLDGDPEDKILYNLDMDPDNLILGGKVSNQLISNIKESFGEEGLDYSQYFKNKHGEEIVSGSEDQEIIGTAESLGYMDLDNFGELFGIERLILDEDYFISGDLEYTYKEDILNAITATKYFTSLMETYYSTPYDMAFVTDKENLVTIVVATPRDSDAPKLAQVSYLEDLYVVHAMYTENTDQKVIEAMKNSGLPIYDIWS